MQLILASASPRRHALLLLLEIPFQVRTANVDEQPQPGESPAETAIRLSQAKAQRAAQSAGRGLILAADTLVVLDNEMLGKPADVGEAFHMLRRLRDRPHDVLTGFVLLSAPSNHVYSEVVSTRVWMRPYTDPEIAAYVAGGDPMDKAGAYAIQHPVFAPVARLDGCPANVMGLPVCRVEQALRRWNWDLGETPVEACRPAQNQCALANRVVPARWR